MLNRIAELKRKGKSSKEALAIALEEARAKKLEEEKKAHKAEKKRKQKEDAQRKRDKKAAQKCASLRGEGGFIVSPICDRITYKLNIE